MGRQVVGSDYDPVDVHFLYRVAAVTFEGMGYYAAEVADGSVEWQWGNNILRMVGER